MKKVLLLTSTLFIVCSRLIAQSIPDGGFEFWNTVTWNNPLYYTSSNYLFNNYFSSGYPANVTQTAGKYGNYGVQIATVKYGNDTLPGLIIDANIGGKGNPTGGIPYTQKPTGIRFWYKYTTTGIDTAVVFAMFKQGGSVMDTFFIPIPSSASTSTYTLISYNSKHPFPKTPDTVIFGAVSSKAIMNNNGNYQKGVVPGSTLVIDSITFTGVGSNQPAELNGNFENWTSDTMDIPPGWYITYPGVSITTDHHAGSYALQVETTNSPNYGAQPGLASTGYYPNNCNANCYELGGFAYTQQKDTLEFWYKYAPKANDTGGVYLNFIKNGQQVNCCAGIAVFQPTAVWTYASVPFSFGTAPDTVIVTIASSSHNHDTSGAQYMPYVGSTLKIDNLTFASQKKSLGVNQLAAPSTRGQLSVYPNPSTGKFTLQSSVVSNQLSVEVYNVLGEKVYSQLMVHRSSFIVDLSSQPNGVYFYRVLTNDGIPEGEGNLVIRK